MMKILNFGSCNIDYVYSLNHIVNGGETESADMLSVLPGGKGLNQSIAVAKAGAEIYHAGCIGTDGEILTDFLSKSGVNISFLEKVDSKNGHAVIQVSSCGENSIVLYPGSNEMLTKPFIDYVFEHFECGDILLLQNEINYIDYIVERAYAKSMCIVFNPSPFNNKINKIDFNMISYVILNEIELSEFSETDDFRDGLMFLKSKYPLLKVVLTLGKNGAVFSDKKREFNQHSFKVNAVDTTGAGDTFTGYFVAELSKGTGYTEILRIASAASALAVTKCGAAPSVPSRDEVLSALEKMTENNTDFRQRDRA